MTDFKQEIIAGLQKFPKQISSKYFYDAIGDQLFQDITKLPEYYLTRSEIEILSQDSLADYFATLFKSLDIYELGAGDGTKTLIFLESLENKHIDFQYFPIDISRNVLEILKKNVAKKLDLNRVKPIVGTYFKTLKNLKTVAERPKLILFLGSNIGNLLHDQAIGFLKELYESLTSGDHVMIGFDLKKDPSLILDAYNDSKGITSAFNKNVLVRINKELNGNFDIEKYSHYPVYNPETGTCFSYLISLVDQTVTIDNHTFNFKKWETIHTEISQKYTHEIINWLANESGFSIKNYFTDKGNTFVDYLFYKT